MFDIVDSLLLFLYGFIEFMLFKFFEELGEKEVVVFMMCVMEI